jgi:hypothetical protein
MTHERAQVNTATTDTASPGVPADGHRSRPSANGQGLGDTPSDGGWFRAPNDLLRVHSQQLRPSGIAVYCCLAMHADATGVSWPSLTLIAHETGQSSRSVIRSISRLEALHLVRVQRPRDGRSNNAYLLTGTLWGSDSQTPPPVPHSHRGSDSQTPPPVPHSHRGSDCGSHEQDPFNKTQRNKTHEHTPPRERRGPSISQKQQEDFARFWSLYPETRKVDEHKALAEWAALDPSPELIETIMEALCQQTASDEWRRDRGRWVPKPDNWLRGKHWNKKVANNGTRTAGRFDPERHRQHYRRPS